MFKGFITCSIVLICLLSPLNIFAKEVFDLRLIRYGPDKTTIVKFNKETGESWIIGIDKALKIKDSKKIPSSLYEVYLTEVPPKQWQAFRIDKVSGKFWMLVKSEWVATP